MAEYNEKVSSEENHSPTGTVVDGTHGDLSHAAEREVIALARTMTQASKHAGEDPNEPGTLNKMFRFMSGMEGHELVYDVSYDISYVK